MSKMFCKKGKRTEGGVFDYEDDISAKEETEI